MLYTHKLTFDLSKQEPRKRIVVVYGSKDTTAVEISLYDGEKPWPLPDGTSCVIRYMKANGNGGVYHGLADGTEAWQVEQNKITILLTPEALDVVGLLDVSVVVAYQGKTLGIYGFDVHVECNILMPANETGDQFDFNDLTQINTGFAALQMELNNKSPISLVSDLELTTPQMLNGTLEHGGYRVTGKLVFVSMSIRLPEDGNWYLARVPFPQYASQPLAATTPDGTAISCYVGSLDDGWGYVLIPLYSPGTLIHVGGFYYAK